MKKIVLLNLVFFITTVTALSQISYEKMIELELKNEYINGRIVEFGKFGFIMTSIKDEKINNEKSF